MASDFTGYPISIETKIWSDTDLDEAQEAIASEYRQSIKWKRLHCQRVTKVDDAQDIYILHTGKSVELDWTWEGAIAFRSYDSPILDDPDAALNAAITAYESPDADDASIWIGEVVEIDESEGEIYVSVGMEQKPPGVGSFYISPFAFLACLHAIYCTDEFPEFHKRLVGRLHLTQTLDTLTQPIRPPITNPHTLLDLWRHPWAILWGPPGTGKTYTIGQEVAAILSDPSERVLVVSTTNKATDEVALSIGRRANQNHIAGGAVLRVGKGADYHAFKNAGYLDILKRTETDLLFMKSLLKAKLEQEQSKPEKAKLRRQMRTLDRAIKDRAADIFVDPTVRVVVSTAFRASTMLLTPNVNDQIKDDRAPFTTVIIDEAGLLSRSATAMLSLLAANRVILVGDPHQLAPISKISRLLPRNQARWLASSALTHLPQLRRLHQSMHQLTRQYRMHPEIRTAVSNYQYEGRLLDADQVVTRRTQVPTLFAQAPRAIWYVLDEDTDNFTQIRAQRGPANRSWTRRITRTVLEKLYSDPQVSGTRGLFISPFRAQAADISAFLADNGITNWTASTVHKQQGAEADIVIFDTVNAGSTAWPLDEWKRLVNVGISRAREVLIVIASRAEMNEPYMRTLATQLSPYIIQRTRQGLQLQPVPALHTFELPPEILSRPDLLGNQIRLRKQLRPVMSAEQQRLSSLKLDGKPRLVRGVAGSGKTVVLAHWVAQVAQQLKNDPNASIWIVYANQSLGSLIRDMITIAWAADNPAEPFPTSSVNQVHVKDILEHLLRSVHISTSQIRFDYDAQADAYLQRVPTPDIQPLCKAMFIDEAQDMGANTLRLLAALVEQSDVADANSYAIQIFYDNAQNVYGRSTPRWSAMGLDMRGRSTVMNESFRSTRPIAEYAINVLYELQPPISDSDHGELVRRQLVEQIDRNEKNWWSVRFAHMDGPLPDFREFSDVQMEYEDIGRQIASWIRNEAVDPADICILYNNGRLVLPALQKYAEPQLASLGIKFNDQAGKKFEYHPNSILVTTPHSFKGYDAEIVIVAGVEQFHAKGTGVLANALYVALTRARSLLVVYGYTDAKNDYARRIINVARRCHQMMRDIPYVDNYMSPIEENEDLLASIDPEHHDWVKDLAARYKISREPLPDDTAPLRTSPLFWYRRDEKRIVACYETRPGTLDRLKLLKADILAIEPGQEVDS